MSPKQAIHVTKLLGHLQAAGIDVLPLRDDQGILTHQLLLFFEGGEKFVVTVDPRPPTVWLKGTHDDPKTSR